MNISVEEIRFVEILLILNTVGWGIATYLGKRELHSISKKFDNQSASIERLNEKLSFAITREECDDNRDKLWDKYDKLSDKHKNYGERLAYLEGVKDHHPYTQR